MDLALLQNFYLVSIFFSVYNFSSVSIFIIFFAFILNSSFIYEYPDVGHQAWPTDLSAPIALSEEKIQAVVGKGHWRTKRNLLAKRPAGCKDDGKPPLSCPCVWAWQFHSDQRVRSPGLSSIASLRTAGSWSHLGRKGALGASSPSPAQSRTGSTASPGCSGLSPGRFWKSLWTEIPWPPWAPLAVLHHSHEGRKFFLLPGHNLWAATCTHCFLSFHCAPLRIDCLWLLRNPLLVCDLTEYFRDANRLKLNFIKQASFTMCHVS